MGELRINLSNFVTVALMAFLGVLLVNKGLRIAGLSQFTTSGS